MQTRHWMQVILLLAGVTCPITLTAQFQNPTDEELKMTAEPKAPGSAAIYLYREETVDDNLHFHSTMARIKVLTEKGKDLATISIPYPKGGYSVTDIKARTIHSDGKIFPLDVKPSDLVEAKGRGFQYNKMVFTLPNVDVGSILEYRWQLRYDDQDLSSPDWQIQQPYFVRKAHYMFVPFKYMDRVVNSHGEGSSKLLFSSMLPPGDKVVYQENADRYTVDVTDLAAIPQEEFMPPYGAFVAQVHFYYSPYFAKDDYWKHEGSRWSKEMDHFANESKSLREAVNGIVAPSDSEVQKAEKLYDAVMAIENTDYTRRKSSAELKQLGIKQTKYAEDVWKQKSGSSDEVALLYLAMARIAGLKAYAMTVCNRDREIFSQYFLSLGQFDDVLILVTVNGKEITLDPGRKLTPFGQLDWRHFFVGGLRQSDKGAIFQTIPGNSYKEAATIRSADLTIDKSGKLTGSIRITMNGPEALQWRHAALENDPEEVKKQFNESLRGMVPDGVDVDFDHFIGLDDFHSMLMALVKVSGNMGTVTGKRVFLPGVFFESRSRHPFVEEAKRTTPIDMGYADSIQDQVTYRLPDDFTIESAPTDMSIPWTGHAVFQIKSNVTTNQVLVTRSLAKNFTLLAPGDYKDLHDFYQKVATADQQPLVLKAVSTNKGN